MELNQSQKSLLFIVIMGLLLYPLFFVLDIITYPDYLYQLLTIRIIVVLFTIILLFAALKIKLTSRQLYFLALIYLLFCCIGISAMCVVVGEGFASPYYAGLLIIIAASPVFLRFEPKFYVILLLAVLSEHFIMLSFLPFEMKSFYKNLFFLLAPMLAAGITQFTIYKMNKEIEILESHLPICMHCKRIRNDDGGWDTMEVYITGSSKTTFTHGLCPDCSKNVYGFDMPPEK